MMGTAKAYMAEGWSVFPVEGKRPATLNGLKDASKDPAKIPIWWERHPKRGIAMATGKPSGLWVLDMDGDEGKQSFMGLQFKHGDLPKTMAAETGAGFHLFFAMPDDRDVRNSASKIAPKVDVRGTGGYVVLPPSPHPSGKRYRWVNGRAPEQIAPAQAPQWLLDLVAPKRTAPKQRAEPVEEAIAEGGRNQTLTSLAGSMRRRGFTQESIEAALLTENREKCVPPLDEDEVRIIAWSVARYEPQAPPSTNGHRAPAPSEPPSAIELPVVDVDVLESIRAEKKAPIDAVPTPWQSWNRVCRGAGGGVGLARGWHIVVGASSGAGKSLIASNIAAHTIQAGYDVALFSLEMSRLENVTRVLSILSGEPVRQLEHGESFRDVTWEQAVECFLKQPGRLYTNEQPIHNLRDIETAMRHHADHGVRVMIVDYLQLAWVGEADTMYQQITEVSHTIQRLAKELHVTTVGLSQVNRRTSSGDHKLAKEGLMGGSSLENDAEMVLLLSKPEREFDGFVSEVSLDKNRHGPTAEWQIKMYPRNLQMREIGRV